MTKKYENEIEYKGYNIVIWNDNGNRTFAIGTKEFPNMLYAKEYANDAAKFNDAYKDDDGVYRWKSNDNVPFTDMLEKWELSANTIAKCEAARDKETGEFLAGYRERMKNYVPSDEEMFEMRAAFGEGETVVNVITGKEIQL